MLTTEATMSWQLLSENDDGSFVSHQSFITDDCPKHHNSGEQSPTKVQGVQAGVGDTQPSNSAPTKVQALIKEPSPPSSSGTQLVSTKSPLTKVPALIEEDTNPNLFPDTQLGDACRDEQHDSCSVKEKEVKVEEAGDAQLPSEAKPGYFTTKSMMVSVEDRLIEFILFVATLVNQNKVTTSCRSMVNSAQDAVSTAFISAKASAKEKYEKCSPGLNTYIGKSGPCFTKCKRYLSGQNGLADMFGNVTSRVSSFTLSSATCVRGFLHHCCISSRSMSSRAIKSTHELLAFFLRVVKHFTNSTKSIKEFLPSLTSARICCVIATLLVMFCALFTGNTILKLRGKIVSLEAENASLVTVLQNEPMVPTLRPDINVGMPPIAFHEYQSVRIHFHDYSSFDSTAGHVLQSLPFKVFHHEWQVAIYPGGGDSTGNRMPSIHLRHLSKSPMAIKFEFAANGSSHERFRAAASMGRQTNSGPQVAKYSSTLGTPRCEHSGSECSSADLLKGHGSSEPNYPNTLDSCLGGGIRGTYYDFSVRRISVKSKSGLDVQKGDTIDIKVDLFCDNPRRNFADIYQTRNPRNPNWEFLGTFECPGHGHQTITTQHKITSGELEQAVRVNFRHEYYSHDKSNKSSCSSGYADVDDLVFQVKERYSIISHLFDKDAPTWGRQINTPKNLHDGTLSIDLRMKLDGAPSRMNFVPENSFNKQMMKLFLDKETSDVLFELPSNDGRSSVQYHAHSVVLKAAAPHLAKLCKSSDKTSPVAVSDTEPGIFLQLLQYVYGATISPNWITDARKFINAAHKFGVANLKIEAEAWHTMYHELTVSNVISELLYADTMDCPLLRESAIDFIVKNSKHVMKSDSFEKVLTNKSTIKDIMFAMAVAETGSKSSDKETELWPINDLRMELYKKGLSIDGPRELLTSRLKK